MPNTESKIHFQARPIGCQLQARRGLDPCTTIEGTALEAAGPVQRRLDIEEQPEARYRGWNRFPRACAVLEAGTRRTIFMPFMVAVLLLGAVVAAPAMAQSGALAAAEALLSEGKVDEALQAYQDLQVDAPDAVEAVLGVGCAQYRKAEMSLAAGQMEEARTNFAAAESTFQRLFSADRDPVRSGAMFNYANALAKTAKSFDPQKEYDQQVEILRKAVGAYEEMLRAFPDHPGARKNLDHVQFVLKSLLQHPPQSPDQPPVQFQLQAVTELPGKTAVVQGNEVMLQDEQPGAAPAPAPAPEPGPGPAQTPAPAQESPEQNPNEVSL